MRTWTTTLALACVLVLNSSGAQAQELLTNGNLDATYQQEIVPGFELPKPAAWVNEGTRAITGAYEDEMSSEPWAGLAPTPVTPNDMAVFFKPFSGNATPDGAATGHLYQDVAGTAGLRYVLTGWAGAQANALMQGAEFALEFRNGGGVITQSVVSLIPDLFVVNGADFNYKQFSVTGIAPAGTTTVRARASMIGATGNPLGGGQAFVVDDFSLTGGAVPEPATVGMLGLGLLALNAVRRRKA